MNSIDTLIAALKKFPSLGSKSARRIAYFLLKQDNEYLEQLGTMITDLKKNLHTCEQCGNISGENPCSICTDPLRDRKILCIVEDIEALSAFEQAGIYNGLYHVLNCRISPFDGEDLNDEAVEFLTRHIKQLKPDEVIIATSPKIEGDILYYSLLDVLRGIEIKRISRLASGLPIGSTIEFADKLTLHTALESRRQVL